MYFSDEITLISEDNSERTIYAQITSVSASETYQAIMAGLKPTVRAVVHMEDYLGEESAVYGGDQYRVIRTYKTADKVELYLERKVGV